MVRIYTHLSLSKRTSTNSGYSGNPDGKRWEGPSALQVSQNRWALPRSPLGSRWNAFPRQDAESLVVFIHSLESLGIGKPGVLHRGVSLPKAPMCMELCLAYGCVWDFTEIVFSQAAQGDSSTQSHSTNLKFFFARRTATDGYLIALNTHGQDHVREVSWQGLHSPICDMRRTQEHWPSRECENRSSP